MFLLKFLNKLRFLNIYHYCYHFVKSTTRFYIFYLSKSSICLGVNGAGAELPRTGVALV
jgi:hypothetical protein